MNKDMNKDMICPPAHINAAIKIIKGQCGDSGEEKLLFAIFEVSLHDLNSFSKGKPTKDRRDAIRYLQGDMPNMGMIGIDREWVLRILKRYGIWRFVE